MTGKYSPTVKIVDRCKVHKYRRFAKTNKTYRLDIYYCVNCPSYVRIENILGHRSLCWRCGEAFTIGHEKGTPLKPTCNCDKRIVKETIPENDSLEWLDSSLNSEASNQSRESIVEDLLSIIESK